MIHNFFHNKTFKSVHFNVKYFLSFLSEDFVLKFSASALH